MTERITKETKTIKLSLPSEIDITFVVIKKKDKSIEKHEFSKKLTEKTEKAAEKLIDDYNAFMKGKPFAKYARKQSSMNSTETYENEHEVVVVMKNRKRESIDKEVEHYVVNRITDHNQKQKDKYYEEKLKYFNSLLEILNDNIQAGIDDDFLYIDENGEWNLDNGSGVRLSVKEMKEDIKNQDKKYNGMLRRVSRKVHNYKNHR